MGALELAGFWAIAALASWIQTLTGFALGLILVGSATLSGLMPVPQAAEITSILVLVNAGLVVPRAWRSVDGRALGWMLAGALPASVAGFALLAWLAGWALDLLRLMLGLLIVGAALQLMRRPHPRPVRSPDATFAASGAAGGVMGGMFASSGPPVIWHMYRQPLTLDRVRVTLVAFFLVTQAWRLVLVLANGGLTAGTLAAAAGAMPAVALGHWLAWRFPPPVSVLTIRRAALALLFLTGALLVATAAPRLI